MGDLKIMAINEFQSYGVQLQPSESPWTVKPCNTTGCSVMIRALRHESPAILNCKWCREGRDYNTDASLIRPTVLEGAYLDRDEFGANLYEVIKTISLLHVLRQQLNRAVYTGKRVAEVTAHYKKEQRYLANQLPQLSNDEMDQILARYPWVTGC
ncbi:MAG: hypothetical protein ACRCZI_15750 [Cetobacterium sp.]